MSWFGNGGNNAARSLKKSQYYVWYLGSKEADGLRGKEHVLPVMRQLLKESLRRYPNKITVQVSQKGLKLIQTVPTMSKSGKLKTELIKFQIPQHSLTFSMVGPAPFTDIVGCILLVFNPETKSPVHVHCYRCDSPETATFMNANLQSLLNKPETQRRLVELERRLTLTGLLQPPPELLSTGAHPQQQQPLTSAALFAKAHPTAVAAPLHLSQLPHQQQQHVQLINKRASQALSAGVGLDALVDHRHQQRQVHGHQQHQQQQHYGSKAGLQSDDDGLSDDDEPILEQWHKAQPIPANAAQLFAGNTKQRRLKKDLFYELKTKLETGAHSDASDKYDRPAKSCTPEYYPKLVEQNSPASAKDSSNTSTTSGLGSDFSSNGLLLSQQQLAMEALLSGPPQRPRHAAPDRRRFSVSDLHQAWRVQESPSPINNVVYNDHHSPPRRKNRYQKNQPFGGVDGSSLQSGSNVSTSVHLNISSSAYNHHHQPPIPPKAHSSSALIKSAADARYAPGGRQPQRQQQHNQQQHQHNQQQHQQQQQQQQLRMFGDTLLKPTDEQQQASKAQRKLQLAAATNDFDVIPLPALKERRRQWRSMDNLHHSVQQQQQAAAYEQAVHRHANFALHMNNTENDQFWRYRAGGAQQPISGLN